MSGDFIEFEDLVSLQVGQDHWKEIASFLYLKSQPPLVEGSDATVPIHGHRQYTPCVSPPACRPKFTRGTVEGEMIHAMSPGSTPNRSCSVLSPLDTRTPSPPTSGQRARARTPLALVMPAAMQDVPSPWNASVVKSSEKVPGRAEGLHAGETTQHFLNSSWNSSDTNTCKENLPVEASNSLDKIPFRAPSPSLAMRFAKEGSLPDSNAAFMQNLTRYDSSVTLPTQAFSNIRYNSQAGTAASQALAKAVDERTVGYFSCASSSVAATSKPGPLVTGAVPPRLGTGSTPVPLRNTATSPRHASPLQMMPNRGSRPPPQFSQVRGATLVANTSGSLRTATFAQCSGSLCVGFSGGGGSGQYQQCNSHVQPVLSQQPVVSQQPVMLRQTQDRRVVISPRF